jgi:hypothetical protein
MSFTSLDSVLSLVSIEKAQSKGKTKFCEEKHAKDLLDSLVDFLVYIFLSLISFYSKEIPTSPFSSQRHFDIFSINILNRRTRRSSEDNKRQRMQKEIALLFTFFHFDSENLIFI